MGNQPCAYGGDNLRLSLIEFPKNNNDCLMKREMTPEERNGSMSGAAGAVLRHYQNKDKGNVSVDGIIWDHTLQTIPEAARCSHIYVLNHDRVLRVIVIEPMQTPAMQLGHVVQSLVWSVMMEPGGLSLLAGSICREHNNNKRKWDEHQETAAATEMRGERERDSDMMVR